MILIGQFDSPFVRRVAIAMNVYGLAFEHRPLSTFRDADELAKSNPLRRVPTLVLDDGEALIESAAILDYLDELAGPDRALVPPSGGARRGILRISALACGACDKMVGLVYEKMLHEVVSPQWVERCEVQLGAVLDRLEVELSTVPSEFWFGDRLTHADVAVTCAMRFLGEAHRESFELSNWPALTALSATCESLEAFKSSVQEFLPPPS